MASAHAPGEVTWVEVPGGRLAVETFGSDTEPVLAIHGISSQRKLWNWLRAAAPDLGLIAPDLRGRGDSVGVMLPSSIGRHAADMVLVLNSLGLEAVHVCGMSMGGFVAVEMATAFPGRVKSLILVDGGFPMAVPPGLTPETLPALFASRLARMDREFGSVREYAKFFARTAPLLDPDDPLLLDYLAHDLYGPLVRLDADALIADAAVVEHKRKPLRRDLGLAHERGAAFDLLLRGRRAFAPAPLILRLLRVCRRGQRQHRRDQRKGQK